MLYLPDRLLVVDHQRGEATWRSYEFEIDGETTAGIARGGPDEPFRFAPPGPGGCDHAPGEYAATVQQAKEKFRAGDLFETVPGMVSWLPAAEPPSAIFRRLMRVNPAPYGFLMNLGEGEYLVGASPEMFVRVEGRRIETCPISGTIRRGGDPIADARQIRALLNSEKDESELTMCTDVDRNDKSRICEPGSVKVIGRRQIEMYSRLIHTVDHVEGILRDGFDALDGFLSHTWAVTVTGAPKKWAMQFVEDHERSPRRWYGGAVGAAFANGNMNTGLALRTIQIRDGVASVRAGATLLFDSDPAEEEDEIRVKASAFLDVLKAAGGIAGGGGTAMRRSAPGSTCCWWTTRIPSSTRWRITSARPGRRWRRCASASTPGLMDQRRPGLVVLSPGPGEPADFGVAETVGACVARAIPVFGVCLGLQGIAEHFGARLEILDYPVHGKPSEIEADPVPLFRGLPARYSVGALPFDLRRRGPGAGGAGGRRPLPRTGWRWRCSTARSRSGRLQFPPGIDPGPGSGARPGADPQRRRPRPGGGRPERDLRGGQIQSGVVASSLLQCPHVARVRGAVGSGACGAVRRAAVLVPVPARGALRAPPRPHSRASRSDPRAQRLIGDRHYTGRGAVKDYVKAFRMAPARGASRRRGGAVPCRLHVRQCPGRAAQPDRGRKVVPAWRRSRERSRRSSTSRSCTARPEARCGTTPKPRGGSAGPRCAAASLRGSIWGSCTSPAWASG